MQSGFRAESDAFCMFAECIVVLGGDVMKKLGFSCMRLPVHGKAKDF